MSSYNIKKGDGLKDPKFSIQEMKLNNSHKTTLVVEQNKHEKDILENKNKHELNVKDKELGWFGRAFGGKDLIALNISGTLIILLIIVGVILTFKILNQKEDDRSLSIENAWAIFTPIITLTLGYVFGSKDKNAS
jgi:hypothetical protein